MSDDDTVLIGLVQMRCGTDVDENLARAERFVRSAAGLGARIVCLPELFATPYFCQTQASSAFALAEQPDGRQVAHMASLAAELGVVLVVPYFEKRATGVYHNTAAVIDADGKVLGHYRKMHIPDDPGFYEKYYFAPGDLGFRAWETAFGKIGVCICWDQWFPEAARLTALAGAEILFYPTAIGWLPSEKTEFGAAQFESWQIGQRAHGIANGCYVAAINRVGHEASPDPAAEGIDFWGQSFLSNPTGQIVDAMDDEAEGVVVAPLERGEIERQRIDFPLLRDRRIDAYGGITQRMLDGDS